MINNYSDLIVLVFKFLLIISIILVFSLKGYILEYLKYFPLKKGKKFMAECLEKRELNLQLKLNDSLPKVSVIIPVFNCQNTIESSIASIQNQLLKEIEIILINDYSSDNSKEIIENIQNKDPRIIIINNNKNMGTLYSRNIGVLYAKGSYIFALDNDDMFLNENIILRLYNTAEKYNYDIIGFKIIYGFNYNSEIEDMYDDPFIKNKKDATIYQPELKFLSIDNNDCHIWGKCIKKEIYQEGVSNFYNKMNISYICFTEDDIMVFMLFSYAKSYRFIPIYGLFHLISNNSASFTLPKDHLAFSKIYYLNFLFDFTMNKIQEKKYVVTAAIKFNNYLKSKNLTFNKKNKKYLNKVLSKIFNCNYILNEQKILIKNIFTF